MIPKTGIKNKKWTDSSTEDAEKRKTALSVFSVYSVEILFLFGFCEFVFGLGSDSNIRAAVSIVEEELHIPFPPDTRRVRANVRVSIIPAEGKKPAHRAKDFSSRPK
uniref:Uncharacterized protein n=1 Tax=Candidatus Kentrum sp. DK TaxID=2126562 RepID=A0A450S7R6_9GAMM|nr:MAG: hypothetical protein BECKDK2373B_GA0170837_10198 [Candidatus Kentron sp. DK]